MPFALHEKATKPPLGARLRIGQRVFRADGTAGGFEDVGAFSIGASRPGPNGAIPPHPTFDWFNKLSADERRTFVLELVHADIDAALGGAMTCHRGLSGDPAPPKNRPFCSSEDMETATRWSADGWSKLRCSELCRYRRSPGLSKGGHPLPPPCKPVSRLLGVPVWRDPEKPGRHRPLMKLVSQSWGTANALGGLRSYLIATANELGLPADKRSFYGVQIILTSELTRNEKGRYWTLSASVTGDLQATLLAQAEKRAQAATDTSAAPSLRDLDTPEERAVEFTDVELGPLPAGEGA